jgi:dTDP-4-dehydrorhamnose reductase
MRCLVIGKSGKLGAALYSYLQELKVNVTGTMRNDFDLRESKELPKADIGFIVAANTKLAECEEDRMGSHLVNVDAPIRIARQMKEMGCFPVYFSSEYATYSGSGAYGHQKALTDTAMQILGGVAILRIRKIKGSPLGIAMRAAEIGFERREGVYIL